MTGTPGHLPYPPTAARAPSRDPLSDVVGAMRLSGGVFLDAEFTAPWCVIAEVGPEDCRHFVPQPAHVIAYHYVVAGQLILQVDGELPLALEAGEIVVIPRNNKHRLGNALEVKPVDANWLIQSPADGGLARIVHGGGGASTHILCGFLGSDTQNHPVVACLPRVLKLKVEEKAAGEWIASSLRFAAHTLREGSATLLTRLAELLFVEAVRRYLATLPSGRIGWLAGLCDPIVGRALALLHERVADPWTTADLASKVGLSRSAFAERFTMLVGEPPMRYLMRWRLQIAADRLRRGREPVSQIAYQVGYESEAAFNRAFRREFGVPPGMWRKQGP